MDFFDHGAPIAALSLAEKAEGGIPGTVFALLEPTPVGCEGKQEPGGKAEGPGKMRSGVVDGDDQVEGRDLGRENVQVGQLVNGEIDEKGRIGLVRSFCSAS